MAKIRMSGTIAITAVQGATERIPFDVDFTYTAIKDEEWVIVANATTIIWDPTADNADALTDFDVLIMLSDKDLDVEFTTNEGDANEELTSFRLKAGWPMVLGADDSFYNHSASNIYGGTLDVIDKIRVDDPNGNAVNLRFILAT